MSNARKSAATPGPWRADGANVFAGNDCIGICDTDNAPKERLEANAKLMAAAPEMLAALKALINGEPDEDRDSLDRKIDQALAIIARAEA